MASVHPKEQDEPCCQLRRDGRWAPSCLSKCPPFPNFYHPIFANNLVSFCHISVIGYIGILKVK